MSTLLDHSSTIDTVYLISGLLYISALSWWRNSTHKMLQIFGNGDVSPLRSKLLRVWVVILLLSVFVRMAAKGESTGTDAGWAQQLQIIGVGLAVRVFALLLLLFAIWHVSSQVRKVVAAAAAAPAPTPAPALEAENTPA